MNSDARVLMQDYSEGAQGYVYRLFEATTCWPGVPFGLQARTVRLFTAPRGGRGAHSMRPPNVHALQLAATADPRRHRLQLRIVSTERLCVSVQPRGGARRAWRLCRAIGPDMIKQIQFLLERSAWSWIDVIGSALI